MAGNRSSDRVVPPGRIAILHYTINHGSRDGSSQTPWPRVRASSASSTRPAFAGLTLFGTCA